MWQNYSLRAMVHPWKRQPTLRLFWSQFFDSNKQTDVVVGDTTFALAEDVAKHPVSLNDYLDYSYMKLGESPELSPDQRTDLGLILERDSGSIGDFRVALLILGLDPGNPRVKLTSSRDYAPEAIKRNSVILIGSRKPNPWVDLYASHLNFTIMYDQIERRSYIRNNAPLPGEKSIYERPSDQEGIAGYSVIALLPDLSHTGSALIVEGLDSKGTRAAGEFLTNEESLQSFKRRLPPGKFPYFELLLRTSALATTPLQSEIVAYRVYSGTSVSSNGSSAP
jgi:hypothetical protein